MLGQLIAASQRLIKPYVEPILKVLIAKLRDTSPNVAVWVLAAIGELAEVGHENVLAFLPQLIPLIIETIQDQSSATKREAALKSLGLLSLNTTYVIDPYIKYPHLLNVLMSILKAEQVQSIRKETVKVIGVIGALDPYRQKTVSLLTDTTISGMDGKSGGFDENYISGPSQSEDYYPTVAMEALMRILKDPSLSVHHTAVVQAVMYIFKTLGLKCVPFLPRVWFPLFAINHIEFRRFYHHY